MKQILLILVGLIALNPVVSLAAAGSGNEVINQLYFFYNQQAINPSDANAVLKSGGFDDLTKLATYGIQASRDVTPKFNIGLRGLIGTSRTEIENTATSSASNYTAYIIRTGLSVILSSPLVKTEKFKAEVLTGFGSGGVSLDLRNGTQDGKYESSSVGPTALVGAAVAFGHKYVFLRIEGGYEYVNATSLNKSGTLTSNLEKIDLSGGYFNVGLLIDGLALGRL